MNSVLIKSEQKAKTCMFVCVVYVQFAVHLGSVAEKRELITYANSKDPDQPAHPRRLVRIFAVRLHNEGTLLKIYN